MSDLRDELLSDPSATFEIEVDLKSGNQLRGIVGPMVGDNVVAQLGFRTLPSDEDMAEAKYIATHMMGEDKAEELAVHYGADALAKSQAFKRRCLGGGLG